MRERVRFQRELDHLDVREFDTSVVPGADSVDEDAAQPLFATAVRDKIGKLLSSSGAKNAVKWNAANHPTISGVDLTALGNRLARYLNRTAIEKAIGTTDSATVIAEMAHQFQQKIYFDTTRHDGKIGEGTLDALGFVRHKGKDLNRVDGSNHHFHAGKDGAGKSAAFQRLESVFRTQKAEFQKVAPDLSPSTWYSFFVNAPFLGRPFKNGIHMELMKRLRLAEKRLFAMTQYAAMSPVELGLALGVDEDHGGGRINSKTSSSMHTFGLATDIGYVKNPWVAGQEGSPGRNSKFRAVSINVSRLINGTDHELKPAWLDWMGTDANRSTGSSFDAIKKCHTDSLAYLKLEKDQAALEAKITEHNLLKGRETLAAAAKRWKGIIRTDRGKLQNAYGSNRKPEDGFLNLHKDLVVALRDTGCLAWGAIDLGASQSGDMMHFDCRVSGIGRVVKPDQAHPVTFGHPCIKATPEREYREFDTKQPPSSLTPWTFDAKTIAVKVAVFVSTAAQRSNGWELLIYAHGHNTCPPKQKNMPLSFITDAPFKLGKVIEASGRPMILVVPFFDWENLIKNKMHMGKDKPMNQWHKIGQPKVLNGVIDEIVAEVVKKLGRTGSRIIRLVLAGHSGAYGFLDPVAYAHADPEMSKPELSKLTHVWGFDTSYTCPGKYWPAWLASTNAPMVSLFYGGHWKTIACGDKFKGLVNQSNGKLFALQVKAEHCEIPNLMLPHMLKCLR